jgi:hypothetical protein
MFSYSLEIEKIKIEGIEQTCFSIGFEKEIHFKIMPFMFLFHSFSTKDAVSFLYIFILSNAILDMNYLVSGPGYVLTFFFIILFLLH